MNFTLALAQVDCVLGDVKKIVRKHLEFVRRARDGGADLVVFPELSLSGYSIKDSNWDAAIRVPRDGAERAKSPLKDLIEASGDIAILLGCVEESEEFGIHNSAF